MLAISFMNEILVASMALAAYLVSSAERTSISTTRSWLRLNGAYRRRISATDSELAAPITIRSGRMQSATASPSLRNSGLETTSKAISSPRSASAWAMAARTLSAVPTGTVDLFTTTVGTRMCRPMVRATANTYCRSALPSSSGGVPTAMKITWPCAIAASASVVKASRNAAWLALTIGSRPGS